MTVVVRMPKLSLKKCFLFTLGFAVLVIFAFSLSNSPFSDKTFWKTRDIQQMQTDRIICSTHEHNPIRSDLDRVPAAEPVLSTPSSTSSMASAASEIHIVEDYEQPPAAAAEAQFVNNDLLLAAGDQQQPEPSLEYKTKPWFFAGGRRRPTETKRNRRTKRRMAKLMPEEDRWTDRIANQLMFVPPGYEDYRASGQMKTILLYNGLGPWGRDVSEGRDVFINAKCPVNTCRLTGDREKARTADMILYKDHFIPTGVHRPANQLFMLYFLECPYHTQQVKFPSVFNWTSTYRKDSDIVAPYEKWEYYDSRVKQITQERNYALNKTKKVAWFVSNCGARNGRLKYAHELGKHIQVDIYGSCGTLKCSRSTAQQCFEILDHDYKFYLAFENSNCKDYITEKFFVNALSRNILPIVMGARPEDYANGAPYRSYIHVDEFASAKELAEYLHQLDQDDELYNSYFKWKGTGEFINTYYWCRVCAMLHDDVAVAAGKWYPDVNEWWRGPGVCTLESWRNFQARKKAMIEDQSVADDDEK